MDAKDLRTESALGDRSNDGNSKFSQGSSVLQCNRNRSYQDIGSNSLGKVDVQTARPCAVIGPDRVIPPASVDAYSKKGPVEPWLSAANYRSPPEYPNKVTEYHHPTRNISPRQTFQENMQRIMVPPSYNSAKIKEDHNFPVDANTSSLRNNKMNNLPTDVKYCDVPYSVNPITNEQKNIRNIDISVSNANPALARSAPHMWPPSTVNVRPSKPYNATELYQYPDYPNCAGPRPMLMRPSHRTVQEDPGHMYSEPYYPDGSIRFKPYPTMKERYPQARYEYNYSNPFPAPPPFPPHKYELQKSLPPHAYPGYSQVPLKYLDSRITEPVINGYQRPLNQQANYNAVPYRNQVIHPNYGPIPGNCLQGNKFYPYPPDSNIKAMSSNKLPYETNHKMYDYDNSRNKTYPMSENFYINEMARSHPMKGQVLTPNYSTVNIHSMPHPYYRKENPNMKNYECGPQFRNIDPSINLNGNLLPRFPSQFSPNAIAISPSDSNTSNDTTLTQGTSQEDCGYVSQSSSASMRSIDSGLNRMPNDFYRRYDYRYGPMVKTSPLMSKAEMNCNIRSKNKKDIDVRQFLQMWNEGEDENGESINKDISAKSISNSANDNANQYDATNQEQLYVLGLVNVPSEELSKYEHIQKVSKLPENIKGYNSIELLNQFEEVVESNLNNYNIKPSVHRDFHVTSLKCPPSMQGISIPSRPISPLDVEAKISQSVIHKEVGCNFEIKPCSPKMLNVEVAAPIQTVLGERVIEKVSNPLIIHSPMLHTVDENIDNCNRIKHQEHTMSNNENSKVPSCKMINTQYSNSNTTDTVKNNYSLHDLESNSGVCLASLPRLDNDIELNFPEVNQQFINANKVESVITTTQKDLPALDIEQPQTHESTNQEIENNRLETNTDVEKEFPKLSKYRKLKRKSFESKENNLELNVQAMRTDSVIIKNPDNFKSQDENGEYFHASLKETKEESINEDPQQNPINLTVHTDDRINDSIDISSDISKSNNTEMAIDFSYQPNEQFDFKSSVRVGELCIDSNKNDYKGKATSLDHADSSLNVSKSSELTKIQEDTLNISDILEVTTNCDENKSEYEANIHLGNNIPTKHLNDINESVKSNLKIMDCNNVSPLLVDTHNDYTNEEFIKNSIENIHHSVSQDFKLKTETNVCGVEKSKTLVGNKKIEDIYSTAHAESIKNVKLVNIEMHNIRQNNGVAITDQAINDVKIETNNKEPSNHDVRQLITSESSSNTKIKTMHESCEKAIDNVNIVANNSVTFVRKQTCYFNKELYSPWIQKLLVYNEGLSTKRVSKSVLSVVNTKLDSLLNVEINTIPETLMVTDIIANDTTVTSAETTQPTIVTNDINGTSNSEQVKIISKASAKEDTSPKLTLKKSASIDNLKNINHINNKILIENINNQSLVDVVDNHTTKKLSDDCLDAIKSSDTKDHSGTAESEHQYDETAENSSTLQVHNKNMMANENSLDEVITDKGTLEPSICKDDDKTLIKSVPESNAEILNSTVSDETHKIFTSSESNILTDSKLIIEPKILCLNTATINKTEESSDQSENDKSNLIPSIEEEKINLRKDIIEHTLEILDSSSSATQKETSKGIIKNMSNSNLYLNFEQKKLLPVETPTNCSSDDNFADNKDFKLKSATTTDSKNRNENEETALATFINDKVSESLLIVKDSSYSDYNQLANSVMIKAVTDITKTYANTNVVDNIITTNSTNELATTTANFLEDLDILHAKSDSITEQTVIITDSNKLSDSKENAMDIDTRTDKLLKIDCGSRYISSEIGATGQDNSEDTETQTVINAHNHNEISKKSNKPILTDKNKFKTNIDPEADINRTFEIKCKESDENELITNYNISIGDEVLSAIKPFDNPCSENNLENSNNSLAKVHYEDNHHGHRTVSHTKQKKIMNDENISGMNINQIASVVKEGEKVTLELHSDLFSDYPKFTGTDQFKEKEQHQYDNFKCGRNGDSSVKKKKKSLKRSLSDSALSSCSIIDLHGNIKVDDIENETLVWSNKRKRIDAENNTEPHIITENYCNILNHNRRNSISSMYNDENVSFCILIDNDCIIAEECEETEKICFTDMPDNLSCVTNDIINENEITDSTAEIISLQEDTNYEFSESFSQDEELDGVEEENLQESWVEDVACVETVISDDVAEDVTISASTSPKDTEVSDDECNSDETAIFNSRNHTDKVKFIYGDKMCSDDAHLVETLYRTPQMDVNKTLVCRESQITEDYSRYYDDVSLEKVLSGSSALEITPDKENASDSISLCPVPMITPTEAANDKENHNLDHDNDHTSFDSLGNQSNTLISLRDPIVEGDFNSKLKTQYDTVHSCESSVDNVFSYKQREGSPNSTISSSPEVSSTTSEERNSSILLKITNYMGSRVSQVNNINSENNKVSCKYTEKKDYLNSNSGLPNRPLITKAAQKYIPPIKETIGDLKIKLPLPQHSLLKLKQMKISKEEPKSIEVNKEKVVKICRKDFPKKTKPKFEDVLKSIDEIQFKMHKEKCKKIKKSIPKVVIKKNENGSHYASTPNTDKYNPDLTGRKWQPWVFLEKDHFIDKMALKNKTKAIFNHRKNTYVLAETFKKYKSISNAKFVISQPSLDDSTIGHLKYTIRLKHSY